MFITSSTLVPIKEELPPPCHTEIKPRCFICKHFPVCNLRVDYLKTAQLISEVLGSPAANYELKPLPIPVKDFIGTTIDFSEEHFLEKITSIKDNEGTFYTAKYADADHIKMVYIFDGYYFIFAADYNEEEQSYDISVGREICYNITCTLKEDILLEMNIKLLDLREFLIEEIKKEEEADDINTTFFSAALECKFYEWEKGLTYEDGVKRMVAKYPHGIPIGEHGEYYHLATFHREPHKVPCYHPENGHVAFSPVPIPVYIPPKCCTKKPLHTRDELNEF